jgi:hypothetical protein
MDHSAKSISDWKAVDRLDKFFSSHNLPDTRITFDKETGGRELSGNYLIDNTRLVSEFGMQYRPYRERVLQIINDIRKEEGLPELAPQ